LFNITSAAITPGTHPHKVSKKVIINDPQPLSITAKGGNIIARITLNKLIVVQFGYWHNYNKVQ